MLVGGTFPGIATHLWYIPEKKAERTNPYADDDTQQGNTGIHFSLLAAGAAELKLGTFVWGIAT